MKKYFMLIAAATTVLVVSCHKKEAPVSVVDPTEVEDNTPVPIQFGVNSAIAVKGNVSTKAAIDEWDGANQTLYIYGIKKASGTSPAETLINNVAAEAPAGNAGAANSRQAINVYRTETEPYYYNATGVYDFYGYFVDDSYLYEYVEQTINPGQDNEYKYYNYQALDPAPANPAPASGTLDFGVTINGTQDIMLAKTDKMADIAYAAQPAPAPNNPDALNINPNEVYSAKAARKGIQPDLIFEHQLSRFVFMLKKGNSTATSPDFTVDSIAIASKYNITLDVDDSSSEFKAANNANPAYIDFILRDEDGYKAGSAAALTAIEEQIGESVMVSPGDQKYNVKVYISSDAISEDIDPIEQEIDLAKLLDIANYKAEKGKKYIVHLTVYGPEAIAVTVTLVDWEDVVLPQIDPDEDTRPVVTITSDDSITAALNTPVELDFTATYLDPQNGETPVPDANITVTSADTRKATVAKNGTSGKWEVTGKQAGKVCNVYISVAAGDDDPFQSKLKVVKVYIPANNTLAVESGYTTLNTNGVGLAWESAEFAITKNGGDLTYVYKDSNNDPATGLAVVAGTTDDTKFKVTKTAAVVAGTYTITITSAAVAAAGDNPGVVEGTTTITVVVPAPVANTLAVEDGFDAIELNAAGTEGESAEFAITTNGGALTYEYKDSNNDPATGLAVVAGTTDDTKFKVTKTDAVAAGTYTITITSAAVAAAGADPGVAEGTATITVTVPNA